MIVVDHPIALFDAPIAIVLEDLGPGVPATITATSEMWGRVWRSHATIIADDAGRVELIRDAPVTGTYSGVSGMGLFWSMAPVSGQSVPAPSDWAMRPSIVRIEAETSGGRRAEATLERRLAGPGVTRRPIREAGVVGTLFLPPGAGPHPAIVVLGGSDGVLPEHRAALVASHGYAALALGYFRGPGLPTELTEIAVEYFENAVRWMRAQPWLRDRYLAVWGASRGGELALLLGATIPEINAIVAYAPSGVLHGDFPPTEPGDPAPRAAWAHRGQPLPYLQENNTADDPASVDYATVPVAESPRYLSNLRDELAVERATIPLEKTRGPILLVSGEDDQIWPSSVLAEIAIRRLAKHRHAYPFRHLRYEGAGHGIYIPYSPTTQIAYVHAVNGVHYTGGGTPRANAEAGVDAWRHVRAFLEEGVSRRK